MTWWYSLVSLLPFEWAAPDTILFMKNALLAVLIISPLFGILSTMVVHSRMSFFSDALGHSAFTGMAIGAICGFQEPTWAAVIFAILFALLFNVVRRRSALGSDTVIGVFSSTAVALGIFLSTLNGRSFTKFNNLLIGDILSVEPGKIGVLALILVLVIALWVLSFNQLMLSAVHPALADSRGIRVFWQETVHRHRRGGHPVHDLGGPAGHQLPAGAARRGGPERRPEHVAVSPAVLPGGGVRRGGRTADLLLHGPLRGCVHHSVPGGVVLGHVFAAEEKLK